MISTNSDSLVINTDGGSRGNPGNAASAFVAKRGDQIMKEFYIFIGIATNNVAEYKALLHAFKWLTENSNVISEKNIQIFMDSELIVKQLKGEYKIKSIELKKLYDQVHIYKNLLTQKTITITHIKRELNKDADRLVNLCLDSLNK
jgi:ribonuclease HI